jgi:Protein of unknown function (DUF3224)
MNSEIKATFEIKGWEEQPFDEAVGVAKLTSASVSKEYAGDIDGSSATEWLMAYEPDKSAVFVGLERIKGTVGGRRGSLVLQHVGTFADGAARATLTVVSGTDELKGATGSGDLVADPNGRITLSVEL